MSPKRKSPAANRRAVEKFNAAHAVGTAVDFYRHPTAEPLTTRTRSEAWLMGEHTAVVMVEHITGCVAIDALKVSR